MSVQEMIHELIDPKKKTNRPRTTSRNAEPKTVSEEINSEVSDTENKESSSTIFIPPWLRNSLGLNQRSNLNLDWSVCLPNFTALGHSTGSSDLKSSKLNQRSKEHTQNELESLKRKKGVEEDRCKKAIENFDILPGDCRQEVNIDPGSDNVEGLENNSEETIPIYWNMRRNGSETEWSCTNAEVKPLKKKDSKMTDTDTLAAAEMEKSMEEDKTRMKSTKEKNKLRKRNIHGSKQTEPDKTEMDFLLEMKAREALKDYMKGDVRSVSSEMRQLEAKLFLLSSKLNEHDLRTLQEVKQQTGSAEQLERVFEHVKEITRNQDFPWKNTTEKTKENKEEKYTREITEGKTKTDKDFLLSTDDENDIKRFSEILNKNKNLEEKKKCLEEVRSYFERKRKTRLSKRRFVEDGKPKLQRERHEEKTKEKGQRGRRSKFSICEEEVVEKAVDEALQKFVDLYHFRVSPRAMGNMKKNILQAITSNSFDCTKLSESSSAFAGTKINLDLLNPKETEKEEEAEGVEIPDKESTPQEQKKKNEQVSRQVENEKNNNFENEKLLRLKKEFEIFLNSVQSHIDVTNLKLHSIILEKEERTSTQNVQLIYNFTKKAVEQEKLDCVPALKDVLEFRNRKDDETQTATDLEPVKRNVKIQAIQHLKALEQSLQTDTKIYSSQVTQTDGEGMTLREIKEVKSNDVNPGLYRMVRSTEEGKFYLYPEQLDGTEREVSEKNNSSEDKDKNVNKKRSAMNASSKEIAKERQIVIRERTKLKKNKRTPMYAVTHVSNAAFRKKKKDESRENSISCLYFRNLDKKDSISSKKEMDLSDENNMGSLPQQREDHMGCYWFWNGEKINPGCDLKAHVENLLKEKLGQMTPPGENQQDCQESQIITPNKESEQVTEIKMDLKKGKTFSVVKKELVDNGLPDEASEKIKGAPVLQEEKKEQTLMSVCQDKPVENASTQESQVKLLNLTKHKNRGNSATTVRRKCTKRNIKPSHGRTVNIRKEQELPKAVEEVKKLEQELEKPKKETSTDSESPLDRSSSTLYKLQDEDTSSMVLGLTESPDTGEVSNAEVKDRLEKLINLVDREVQTCDVQGAEDGNSVESATPGSSFSNQKHLELIGRVLGKVSHRQKENLWNDVRHFIKTKIGKDINEEGTKEVCIEIEQDLSKTDQGKHPVLAKGHYCKSEGDVEVEIDLTLEDLARILCQRQKKIRRRNVYRSRKSKNILSSSSGKSDTTKEEIPRYEEYLNGFATTGQGLSPDKDSKAFKVKTKGN